MKEFLAITKALSDQGRVRALLALAEDELCVCQIIELLGLAASTVSKHMSILHQANLVETRKDGRWIYYRLADSDKNSCHAKAIKFAMQSLESDTQTKADKKKISCVRKMDKEQLCKRNKK